MRRSMLSTCDPWGSKYGVYVPLPTGPGRNRRFVFGRKSGPDFSSRLGYGRCADSIASDRLR